MFGFLGSPCGTCASDESHSTYRGFFCGLSGALRDDYSPAARLLVNRDSTFLSLFTASLSPTPPESVSRTCCNPISVPRPLFSDGLHSRYAAAVTVCGLAAKLDDDRADETGLRRTAARILGRTINPLTDRAISFLNSVAFPTAEVVAMMEEQSAIESRSPDLLTAASPTAGAYGTIFSEAARLAGAPEKQGKLRSIGQSLGRLIYWRDAWDDREEDEQRGRFNPLVKGDPEEFRHHVGQSFAQLSEVQSVPGTFQNPIREVFSSTLGRHKDFIPATALAQLGGQKPPSKKKIEGEKDNPCSRCCDHLICCDFGGEAICCLGCESISCCN